MRFSRAARAGAIAGLTALAVGAQVSLSGAEEPAETISGTAETIDPLVGFDWAPPVDDGEVAAAVAKGASVTEEPCAFGDRPGVVDPQIFRRPIRTTGHLVVTPSGNVTLICHAAAEARSFQPPLPSQAIVVDGAPCFLPNRRRTDDSHLVVTPSLRVHLTCHINPAP